MIDYKPLSVPISMGTKLLVEKCPTTYFYMEDMASLTCANALVY